MKKIASVIIMMLCLLSVTAQESKIIGEWLLKKVEVGEKIHEPFFITSFKQNGTMEVMGMDAGTWKFDKKENKIIMKSELDKDFNGDNNIISISNKELIATKDKAKLYYVKVDKKEIENENATAELDGEWKLKNEMDQTQLLKIELPDSFMLTQISEGSTSTTKGTWIYNSAKKTVIFIGRSRELKGEKQVKEISEEKFVLESNGIEIIGEKNSSTNGIEHLTFTYKDLPEEPNETSPWINFDEMLEYLASVQHLKYKRSELINNTTSFNYSVLLSKINVNSEERRVSLNNLRIIKQDTLQYSESVKGDLYNEYNNFFPQEELYPFKITKTELITVPAGTFNCKVVEGFNGEAKIKYWMIIDKPGVYAKIITEDIDVFGDAAYSVIELEEIK